MLPFFSLPVSKIVLRFPESPQDFSRLFYFFCIPAILFDAYDFTFIGEEYRVQIGGQDFYIDLLFYSRALSCLVPSVILLSSFKKFTEDIMRYT